jgi:hypothetical protein
MNKKGGMQDRNLEDPFDEEEDFKGDFMNKGTKPKDKNIMGEDFDNDMRGGKSKNIMENRSTKPMPEMSIKTTKNMFETNSKVGGLETSSFSNRGGIGMANEEKTFSMKYRDNIRKIFDECSEKGEIEIPKLKGLLAEAGFFGKRFNLKMNFRCE